MDRSPGLSFINPRRRDRGTVWTEEEMIDLVTIWSRDDIQYQLTQSTHNSHVYDRLAREMCDRGHERTAAQCNAKIKALKRESLLMDHKRLPRNRLRFIARPAALMLATLRKARGQRCGSDTSALSDNSVTNHSGDSLDIDFEAIDGESKNEDPDDVDDFMSKEDINDEETTSPQALEGVYQPPERPANGEIPSGSGVASRPATSRTSTLTSSDAKITKCLLDELLVYQRESTRRYLEHIERCRQIEEDSLRRRREDERRHHSLMMNMLLQLTNEITSQTVPPSTRPIPVDPLMTSTPEQNNS